jgi:pSer/pThr/pTyr-binding forkhead associated (FHA) protein
MISLVPSGTRVKIGRQTNAKTVPGERNGYFDSKVLSRQHAEVWEEGGKVRSLVLCIIYASKLDRCMNVTFFSALITQIFIKDVKSSNGTFVNGDRLSAEGVESDPWELKTEDRVVRL